MLQLLRVGSVCQTYLPFFKSCSMGKPFPERCCMLQPGLSPTRWHCVHAIQAEGLRLVFLPPKTISWAALATLASHPPSLGRQDGDAEGCTQPACPRALFPAAHPARAVLLEKRKKLQAKLMQGECQERWELLWAAAAKHEHGAAGMRCGSAEEMSPSPAPSSCPAKAGTEKPLNLWLQWARGGFWAVGLEEGQLHLLVTALPLP